MLPLRTVLLDLDGTLIDHFRTIHACYRHTLGSMGRPVPTMEEVRRAVGGTMEVTMRRFVPEDGEHARAVAIYRDYFRRHVCDEVDALPGAMELLQGLTARGLCCAVFTNKQGEASRMVCAHLGFTPYLAGVFGSLDTPWRKPMPEFARHVLTALESRAEESALVGDSPYDVEAARAAGLRCWCVTTGTHTAAELIEAGLPAAAIFPTLSELGRSVFGLAAHP